MDYLNKNLLLLKEKDYLLYSCLKEKINVNKEVKKFKIVETRDGEKTIEILSENGESIRLNSTYNSKKEAESWKKQYNVNDNFAILVMYGYGNGIFYNALKKQLSDSAQIYIYEPDIELFLFCLQRFDMEDILSDARVKLYVYEINDKNFFADLYKNTNWAMLSSRIICVHPAYDRIYKDQCKYFNTIIDEYLYAMKVQQNTSIRYAKKFTVNAIKNLRFIKNSNYLGEFIGKVDKDIPVIIVSAGPSLDKNIDELKKAEKRAFILATDTSVRYLLKSEINFDAIVTIDGDKQIKNLGGKKCERKPIFTILDAKYQLLDENKGRKIWITGYGYLEKLYKKYGYIFPEYVAGGSVATAAFWIAYTIGVKNIILVGQDLAYEGEITHAGKTIGRKVPGDMSKEIYVEGINQSKIKTRGDWIKYLQWFENIIKSIDDVNVIDATEGGAKINGTKIMCLSDAIKKYCNKEFDFEKIIYNLKPTFSSSLYKNVCKDIMNIKNEFNIIKEMSNDGIVAANELIQIIEKHIDLMQRVGFNYDKIENIKKVIQSQDIYMLIDEYISQEIMEIVGSDKKESKDTNSSFLVYAKENKKLFEVLIEACEKLENVLTETIKKI